MRRRHNARRPIEIASMRHFASLTRRKAGVGIRRAGPPSKAISGRALGEETPAYVSTKLSGARANAGGGILTIKVVVGPRKIKWIKGVSSWTIDKRPSCSSNC